MRIPTVDLRKNPTSMLCVGFSFHFVAPDVMEIREARFDLFACKLVHLPGHRQRQFIAGKKIPCWYVYSNIFDIHTFYHIIQCGYYSKLEFTKHGARRDALDFVGFWNITMFIIINIIAIVMCRVCGYALWLIYGYEIE